MPRFCIAERLADFARPTSMVDRPRANINLPVKPAGLYGPAVRCKPDVMNGNVWSCASVSGP